MSQLSPFRANELLGRHYQLPVLPIGLYLQVGKGGVGWDVYERFFWDRQVLHFLYPYIGLPALDAERYVSGENILGVALAALLRVAPARRVWLKEQALQRVYACRENDARRFLLFECVHAYLPLAGPQQDEFPDTYSCFTFSCLWPLEGFSCASAPPARSV
jgi:hypothetical protein